MRERTTLSEHRIATILEQARRFNRAANPDRAARVSILDSEIARLTEERDRLNAGGEMDRWMATTCSRLRRAHRPGRRASLGLRSRLGVVHVLA